MIIPYQSIEADTLINLIQSFVLREGTDYGEQEKSLQEKTQNIHRQLVSGELVIVYSELHESVSIMNKQQFNLTKA